MLATSEKVSAGQVLDTLAWAGHSNPMRPPITDLPEDLARHMAVVDAASHGLRLDQALALLTPGLGRRGRLRLLQEFEVLVDGRPQAKGFRVQQGQSLSLRPRTSSQSTSESAPELELLVLIQDEGFAALYKPGGRDSASLAGKTTPLSVEGRLPSLFPGRDPRLCNRLDRPTSGILLVGFGQEMVIRYRELENAGLVDKRYLALVHGLLESEITPHNALDTARRSVTRVLDTPAPPERWTRVTPLEHRLVDGAPATLVQARIRKGARHQIRAHLAHAGHPIVGDTLYGQGQGEGPLHLLHAALRMPGFEATCAPHWPAWAATMADALTRNGWR
jgi:23S rRNA pseudouridine1911/1915/1917 synthase